LGCSEDVTQPAAEVVSSSTSGTGGSHAGGATASTSPSTAATGGSAGEVPYPDPDWAEGDPSEHGLDPQKLAEAASVAEGLESYCLLVFRHGVLVSENYWQGHDAQTPQTSWSIAKSYASTLVGIAVANGDIGSVDDPVANYIADWPHPGITIRHLLSMTSGLEWSLFGDYVSMSTFADDHTAYALELSESEPPETNWTYNNGAVQLLEPLFRGATGMTIEEYAAQHLWPRIGMQASWAHDPSGNPTVYASVLASCRDHARLGYLFLHGGTWAGGESIVQSSWVSDAITPSQTHNRAYGLMWWLNGETPAVDPMMEPLPGRLSPNAPTDLFGARGFGNQFIDVLPRLDLMVVRFGTDPLNPFDAAELFDDARFAKHDAILEAVLAAVVE
jgi:CubicO group peptidase (beta-lactamase class C family)